MIGWGGRELSAERSPCPKDDRVRWVRTWGAVALLAGTGRQQSPSPGQTRSFPCVTWMKNAKVLPSRGIGSFKIISAFRSRICVGLIYLFMSLQYNDVHKTMLWEIVSFSPIIGKLDSECIWKMLKIDFKWVQVGIQSLNLELCDAQPLCGLLFLSLRNLC